MLLRDVGPAGFGDDYVDFDMLILLNLGDTVLTNPGIDVDDDGGVTDLLTRGPANNPVFGGDGPVVLEELVVDDVWATLVPEGSTGFTGQVQIGGSVLTESADLRPGDVVYFVVDTVCHLPGTRAELSLTLPEPAILIGHLGHGDTLGACLPPANLVERMLNFMRDLFAAG